MPRKRLSRKELVQKDEITTTLEQATSYVLDRLKIFLTVAGFIGLLAVAVVGWRLYSAGRTADSQDALSRVILAYNNTADYPFDEDRLRATLREAERVEADYPNLKAAEIARYYAALSHQGLGEVEEGYALLRQLIASADESIQLLARYALAESLKSAGNLEEAIEEFKELNEAGGYAQGAVLIELGRLHEAVARPDEARTYYEALLGDAYLNSPFRLDAERALKQLDETLGPSPEADS